MKKVISVLFLLGLIVNTSAFADEVVKVKVVEPYLELHTGPAETFPVTYSVDMNRELSIVKERNDWYQLQNEEGLTGWAPREVVEKTIVVAGVDSQDIGKRFAVPWNNHFEIGIAAGTLSGNSIVTYRGAYYYNEMLGGELSYSKIGNDLDAFDINTSMWMANLLLAPVGRQPMFWNMHYTPFGKLGIGSINYSTSDKAIGDDSDKIDESALAFDLGIGARIDITRNFAVRFDADYIMASFDESDDVSETIKADLPSNEFALTAGLSIFF